MEVFMSNGDHIGPDPVVLGVVRMSSTTFWAVWLIAAKRSTSYSSTQRLKMTMRYAHQERCVSPASFIARGISGFRMNHFHRFPVRRFSALNSVIPTSRPRTSGETQPSVG